MRISVCALLAKASRWRTALPTKSTVCLAGFAGKFFVIVIAPFVRCVIFATVEKRTIRRRDMQR